MIEQPKKIYIIGAGGHGKVAIRAAQLGGTEVVAVFDDALEKQGNTICDVLIVGNVLSILEASPLPTLIAIGSNQSRMMFAEKLKLSWATIVHPSAYIDSSVKLGAGVLVLAHAVIQADALLEDHVIVNNNATIEHDCRAAIASHVSSNACLSGGTSIGKATLVGAGAIVLPGIQVGDSSTIGGGAVVTKNVGDYMTAVGVPARVIKPNDRDATAQD